MKRIEVSGQGTLTFLGGTYPCALGRGGVTRHKREGDGATPIGTFPLRCMMYRPDRISQPVCRLPTRAVEARDGWCDAPEDPNYNQMVTLPYPASTEHLWREDSLYDIVAVIGYNDGPAVPGRGSAIFLHLARENYAPTEGCVALSLEDLLAVLKDCDEETEISVSE